MASNLRRKPADYNEKLLKIVEQKREVFKRNMADGEMRFLMSVHPFLKQIPAASQWQNYLRTLPVFSRI